MAMENPIFFCEISTQESQGDIAKQSDTGGEPDTKAGSHDPKSWIDPLPN